MDDFPVTHLIFFWISSANFNVVPAQHEGTPATISSSRGETVGFLGTLLSDYSPHARGSYEFIILGSRRVQGSEPVLLVIQIEWRHAVAHRLNYGEIKESDWEKETHQWKLIPLIPLT
ncbi:hypothetical protein PT974_04485 [Cladobotryum mycophilum]|uniref:Uncharacterized protein n=1 Tax=Cladobotryum mycophilum TaxID=491253 RepID=A0ABR0SV84_9HYPO